MMRKRFLYSYSLLLLTLCLSPALKAVEVRDSLERSFSISPSGNLTFIANCADVEVLVWDRSEVKLVGKLSCSGDAYDAERVARAFRAYTAIPTDRVLEVNTAFIRSFVVGGLAQNVTTLASGEVVPLSRKSIKLSYRLWVPKSLAVSLDAGYGAVKLADLLGTVKLSLSNCTLSMGSFGAQGIFDLKYSDASIGNGGDATLTLTKSTASMGEVSNLNLNSTYSKLGVKKVTATTLISNGGSYTFNELSRLVANSSFSSIQLNSNASNVQLRLYNGSMLAKDIESFYLGANYSTVKLNEVGLLDCPQSYELQLELGSALVVKLSDSKFDTIRIGELVASADFSSTFSSTIRIGRCANQLVNLSGNFVLGSLHFKLAPETTFRLSYSSNTPKLPFAPQWFKKAPTQRTDGARTTFTAVPSEATTCSITINVHDTDVKVE